MCHCVGKHIVTEKVESRHKVACRPTSTRSNFGTLTFLYPKLKGQWDRTWYWRHTVVSTCANILGPKLDACLIVITFVRITHLFSAHVMLPQRRQRIPVAFRKSVFSSNRPGGEQKYPEDTIEHVVAAEIIRYWEQQVIGPVGMYAFKPQYQN